jgi:hypothetical protein
MGGTREANSPSSQIELVQMYTAYVVVLLTTTVSFSILIPFFASLPGIDPPTLTVDQHSIGTRSTLRIPQKGD